MQINQISIKTSIYIAEVNYESNILEAGFDDAEMEFIYEETVDAVKLNKEKDNL